MISVCRYDASILSVALLFVSAVLEHWCSLFMFPCSLSHFDLFVLLAVTYIVCGEIISYASESDFRKQSILKGCSSHMLLRNSLPYILLFANCMYATALSFSVTHTLISSLATLVLCFPAPILYDIQPFLCQCKSNSNNINYC